MPESASPASYRTTLHQRYDQLWSKSIEIIRSGKVEIDATLAARKMDNRRGLTVIGRPSPRVCKEVSAFLHDLHLIDPEQHYYVPEEFHLTILSLFTATVKHEPFLARKSEYISAVDAALRDVPPIEIVFEGITVSPGTVMIQGFFDDTALNDLRDSLRRELVSRGLAESLDERYRLESAHMTVMRFRAPLIDSNRFTARLESGRTHYFGPSVLESLYLVKNDWYMTRQVTEMIKQYPLHRSGANTPAAL